jgi:predicted dehydrogenase
MGVLSELIHPMDLTRLLFAPEPIVAAAGIGTHSDFSPCAETALDSVSVVVHAGDTPVVIHSSFVWSRRIRSLTAVVRADDRMYRIELVYDTPKWDCDRLEIVRIDLGGRLEPVYTHATDVTDLPSTIRGVGKVAAYVKRSVDSWRNGRPDPMLVRLEEAVGLQRDLHAIHASLGSTLAAGGYHGTTTSIAAH